MGETKCRLGTRLKEHKEHAWMNDHPINWAGMKILQHANRTMELVLKEVLSIHMTPGGACFYRGSGTRMSFLIATYNKLKGKVSSTRQKTCGAHDLS